MNPDNKNKSLKLSSRILILINALFWLGFSILTALGLHPGLPEGPFFRWGIASLAFASGALLVALFWLSDRFKIAYYLLLGQLAGIILLSFTDDFGLSDLVVLLLHLASFVLLVLNRQAAYKTA